MQYTATLSPNAALYEFTTRAYSAARAFVPLKGSIALTHGGSPAMIIPRLTIRALTLSDGLQSESPPVIITEA